MRMKVKRGSRHEISLSNITQGQMQPQVTPIHWADVSGLVEMSSDSDGPNNRTAEMFEKLAYSK